MRIKAMVFAAGLGTRLYPLTANRPKALVRLNGVPLLQHVLDTGVAGVRLNGRDLGIVWTKPFGVDITGALSNGENVLEVKVVNSWYNRVLGDQLHAGGGKTWTKTNIEIANRRGRSQTWRTNAAYVYKAANCSIFFYYKVIYWSSVGFNCNGADAGKRVDNVALRDIWDRAAGCF